MIALEMTIVNAGALCSIQAYLHFFAVKPGLGRRCLPDRRSLWLLRLGVGSATAGRRNVLPGWLGRLDLLLLAGAGLRRTRKRWSAVRPLQGMGGALTSAVHPWHES